LGKKTRLIFLRSSAKFIANSSPRVNLISNNRSGKGAASLKEYVQNNLEEVNSRLAEQRMREIDPADPQMAARYG
jgi:hypothetical protein